MKKQFNDYKSLNKNRKDLHQQKVSKITDETYGGDDIHFRLNEYNRIKHMRWFHYVISLSITIVITGVSFLIGYLTRNSSKMPDYQGAGWFSLIFGVLIILIMMVLNWAKNRDASKHFQDKRRRYQRTLSKTEAKIILTNKILFLSFFLLIPVIISTNICFQ